MTNFAHALFRYVLEMSGGAVIGIALLGQYFIGVATATHARNGSAKEKFVAFSARIGAAILSFAVLVLVSRAVRVVADFSILDSLAVAIGLASAVGIAWKKRIKGKKK